MAEEQHTPVGVPEDEIKDRGMFDFLGKKEEVKPQEEDVLATQLDEVHIAEGQEKKHTSLLEKMHQSDSSSSSSSSSEEEVEEGGEKIRRKKKKKGLKEKILGDKEEVVEAEDTSIPIEKVDQGVIEHPEEKKSFMEKIKDKLPGHKKTEEAATPAADCTAPPPPQDADPKEKKGLLEKIKEKLPGYHKTEEEKKETSTTEH